MGHRLIRVLDEAAVLLRGNLVIGRAVIDVLFSGENFIENLCNFLHLNVYSLQGCKQFYKRHGVCNGLSVFFCCCLACGYKISTFWLCFLVLIANGIVMVSCTLDTFGLYSASAL